MNDPRPLSLTDPGRFVIGCNYWASHAGTAMWSDWRPDVVADDLRQLAAAGLHALRVFPLWPEFQPLTLLRGYLGRGVEHRHGERPLADDDAGRAGVCEQAMGRFAELADLAQAGGLKLIVALVTGWMSGRLFVPPALEGLNILTDPTAIQWQVRFVRYFVRRFASHPAVLAWDLGNECNCMSEVGSREEAWVWTAAITQAIRAADPTRPIVSGMHGLSLQDREHAHWTIRDQAELTDVLTTHPYPIFTPHCDRDPITTIRSCLHATVESRLYADVGDRPCLAEEVGTIGPMICDERTAADYVRTVLLSLWAHDCHGMLWWCGYDQSHLTHAPYDWLAVERELGLFRPDRSSKPVREAIARFGAFLESLPLPALPQRITEAVCILTADQDQWAAAQASFILAKQAGFDLSFQYVDSPLKDAPLYLAPGVSGSQSFSRRFWLSLLESVRRGATLYLSHNDCLLSPFVEPFGLEVRTRQRHTAPAEIGLDQAPGSPALTIEAPFRLTLAPTSAEVLAREADGNPTWTCAPCGQGRAYFLSVPIELHLARTAGAFHADAAQPFWRVYQRLAESLSAGRIVRKDHPLVGVTEHPVAADCHVVVLINYSPQPQRTEVTLAGGWTVSETWYGPAPDGGACDLPANDAAVFTVSPGAARAADAGTTG